MVNWYANYNFNNPYAAYYMQQYQSYYPQMYYYPQTYSAPYYNNPIQQSYTKPIQNNVNTDTISFGVNKQFTSAKSEKTKGLSKTAKWAIGIGAAALAAGAIYLLTKGKSGIKLTKAQKSKVQELIKSGRLSSNDAEIFKSVEGLEGDDFIKEAYKQVSKSMGYDRLTCPKLRIAHDSSLKGGGGAGLGHITINTGAPKENTIGTIRHELEHHRQNEIVYRAFGKDAFLEATINRNMVRLKENESYCMEKFGKKYAELTEAELESYKEAAKKVYLDEGFDILELLTTQKGRILRGSTEFNEAEKFLEATRNSRIPTMYGEGSKDLTVEYMKRLEQENPELLNKIVKVFDQYYNNPLEVGAYAAGDAMRDKYKLFKDAIK